MKSQYRSDCLMEMERCGSERSAGNLNMETRSGKLEYMETRESQPQTGDSQETHLRDASES